MTKREQDVSSLVWEILQTANRLIEAGNRLSAPFGLTAARWQVMGVIAQEPGSVAEVARRLSQTRQGVQRLADELVGDGLAAWAVNPRHARAKLLVPTAPGEAAYRGLMEVQARWIEGLSAGLGDEEIAAAREVLARLTAAMKADGA